MHMRRTVNPALNETCEDYENSEKFAIFVKFVAKRKIVKNLILFNPGH